MTKANKPSAPKHLRRDFSEFFSKTMKDFELDDHHVILLTKACESLTELKRRGTLSAKKVLRTETASAVPAPTRPWQSSATTRSAWHVSFENWALILLATARRSLPRFQPTGGNERCRYEKGVLSRSALDDGARLWLDGDERCGFYQFRTQEQLEAVGITTATKRRCFGAADITFQSHGRS